jgi:hypothetical protein
MEPAVKRMLSGVKGDLLFAVKEGVKERRVFK